MTDGSVWSYKAALVRYTYFSNKPRFALAVSVDPNWTSFAVEKGDFSYSIGDEKGRAAAGDIIICPPGIPFHRLTEHPISFHYFVFDWTDEEGHMIPCHLQPQTAKLPIRDTARLSSTLALMRLTLKQNAADLAAYRNHLLNDILRLYFAEQQLSLGYNQSADSLMVQVKAFFDQTFQQPLQMQEIAAEHGLSTVQFSRRFQRAYGINPSEYVTNLRLKKACYLLTHTGMTIDEIAVKCGYNNGFYLCRVFAAKMKIPPSQYRKQHRV